ncbi:ATP-binding cassette domain-containing protein [Stackebrandtia soli]|uniref:ATP-binding cassette domain-containing protein n=1 Tax=Stackebrandtia soli TaxID=1892856 RepID=UPI0039EC9D60
MIDVHELTKRYGPVTAVSDLSFTIRGGAVTGFLGPNGAGKSTTMRMILGLDAPTSGSALVNGRPYRNTPRPLTEIGALLDASAVHGGYNAVTHLTALARSNRIGRRRVAEVLDTVGLTDVAHRRVKGYSLGMRQRLGVAAALLGDPGVLLFDEPVNGLDPEGIRWIRGLMRRLAAEGRTVLVSSHLMTEMALTADRILVLGRGRLLLESSIAEMTARHRTDVLVRTDDPTRATTVFADAGGQVTTEDDALIVVGLPHTELGRIAAGNGVVLTELTPRSASLEDAYLRLTADHTDYTEGNADVDSRR